MDTKLFLVFHVNIFLLGTSRLRNKEINGLTKRWYKSARSTIHAR